MIITKKANEYVYIKRLFRYSFVIGAFLGFSISFFMKNDVALSFVFGGMFGLILGFLGLTAGWIQVHFTKRLAIDNEIDGFYEITQVRTIKNRLPLKDSYELCLKSLELIEGCKVYRSDCLYKSITAARRIWNRSFIINFDLNDSLESTTVITITVKPSNRFVLVDYGRNLSIVQKLTGYITDKLVEVDHESTNSVSPELGIP